MTDSLCNDVLFFLQLLLQDLLEVLLRAGDLGQLAGPVHVLQPHAFAELALQQLAAQAHLAAQALLREQAAAAMKRRDLTLSLQQKEVAFGVC